LGSLLYSLARVLLDVVATSHRNQAQLQSEVLALRRQVQVLERQIKRVRWSPEDRMVWGTQSPSSSMSHSQKVTEQRKARTGYDLRPS
jgi:hypothetical protein